MLIYGNSKYGDSGILLWQYAYKEGWTRYTPPSNDDDDINFSIPIVVGVIAVIGGGSYLLRRRN